MDLAYRFRAYFADGDFYTQSEDDSPSIAPEGSSFTDVLNLQAQGKQLVAFALIPAGGEEPIAAVHLDTGHFELGGHEFWAGEPGEDHSLVYHRTVTRTRSMDVDAVTLEELGEWRESTHVRYVIGCGKATIGIDG